MSDIATPDPTPGQGPASSPAGDIVEHTTGMEESTAVARVHADLQTQLSILAQVRAQLVAMASRRAPKLPES